MKGLNRIEGKLFIDEVSLEDLLENMEHLFMYILAVNLKKT